MKYLSHYTEEAQTNLFNETGAFFAFSTKQFEEAQDEKVEKYVSMGAGLICPKENALTLHNGLNDINKNGIELDMKENGKKKIIWRELANHECQISMDIDDAIQKLADYPITEADVKAEWPAYWDNCVENDCF